MFGTINIGSETSLYMGTLFMRMISGQHTLKEIKKLVLNDINLRKPAGLVRKMGNRQGIIHVAPGDLVVITHSNGFHGNSGVVAIARATSYCLGPDPTTNPPLMGDECYGVTINDVIWMPNQMSNIELKAWAYEVDNRSEYLDGAGWAYTDKELDHVFE